MRANVASCAAEGHCDSARRLLVGGAAVAPPALLPASSPSPDAQRARLERVLCATTAVLFAASVSYIALSTLFACFCARRPPRRSDAESAETKRALEEIPVVGVVRLRNGPDGDRSRAGGLLQEEHSEAVGEECAVCLAEYASGEEVRVLPACRHGFHRECVDRWLLTRAPTCPVCRASVAASSEGRDAKGCATGDAVIPVGI